MIGGLLVALESWFRADVSRAARRVSHARSRVIRRLAREKLARTLRWVWDRSPAQRERWRSAGLARGDLRSPGVLSAIPFTGGADLASRPEDFLCAPRADLVHVLTTSGTGGTRKKIFLTASEYRRQVDTIGVNLRRLPGASRGLAIFDVGNPTWSSGTVARRGIEAAGMFSLLSGTHSRIETHVAIIREYAIDTVITTSTTALRIACETGPELASLGVRWLLIGTQPWGEDLRRRLESAWGAKTIDVYGSTEFACGIASECPAQDGLHINEPDLWPEAIDPATGRGLADGEEGELVLTTLARRGMPLVRYRTGDFATLLPRRGRCSCGSPMRRISRIRGRVDDLIVLGAGNKVFPDEFDRALLALPGVTDYQVVIEKSEGWRDVIRVTVELVPGSAVARGDVERALVGVRNVNHSLSVEGNLIIGAVDFAAPGTLSAGRPKTQRIVDRRTA